MTEASPQRANMGFIGAIVAVATIGGFMFGYDSGVINGTQEGLESAFELSELGTGVNVGAILIGCAVGAFAAGRLADGIGRRNVMLIAAVLFILSALGTGAADSSIVFVVARFIGGLGVGAASVLSPAYISEVTPASTRGRLSSIQQVMIITGLTAAFFANYFLAKWANGSTGEFWMGYPAWRWMFWMQLLPATIFLLSLLLIPESPRYLVSKGREAKAEEVLTRLFGSDVAAAKVVEIRDSLAKDHRPRLSDLKDEGGKIRPIVWTGIGLAVFQQLVGINIVFYYGAVLWRSVGYTEADALQTNIISGVVSIAACIVAILVIDRLGRKPMLLIGSAGMALTLGLMAIAFATGTLGADGNLQMSKAMGVLAFTSAMAYAALFNFSWGPVMWVMLGEMFPNQIRGSGLAVAGFAQWMANFGIVVSFPWLLTNIGLPITYGFYAVSALVSFFFVRAMVRETRGRELEEMQG
jgi:SP family sugar:H+ symporter-like MFS transporter